MEIASNDVRRSVTYHPSVWGDYFLAYTSKVTEISVGEKEEHEKQREEIRILLQQTGDDSTRKLELIDSIQRLGVGYHFEKEIDDSLRYIYNNHSTKNDQDDIRVVALRFRLLRQQGFPVPCDVFSKFVDEEGKLKESMMKDVEGLLSLYEASNFGIEGEEILEKALEFSSLGLESSVNISRRVKDALKIPMRKTLTRLGARKFISMYEEEDKDCSHSKTLILNFGKLDFNMVQKIHQKELCHLTRWWKEIDFANKLSFARDRLVECYFWIVGVFFEPRHGIARQLLTKVIYLGSYLDDIYDVYGTLEDLTLYTSIIRRWDMIDAVDELHLPAYMRIHYKALVDVYVEMEEEMGKIGKSYAVEYAREEMKTMAEAYLQEARWSFSKYKPSVDEYMKVALVSSGYTMLSVTGLTVIEDAVSKEELDWVVSEPPLLRASLIITRLMDDLAGYRFEEKLSAVHYYVEEKGVAEAEACAELRKQVERAWKDLNRECLEPRAAAAPVLSCVLNFTRVIALLYCDQDDAYGNSQNKTKQAIQSLLVHPLAL